METLNAVITATLLVWTATGIWSLGKMITVLQAELTRIRRELAVLQYEVNRIGERLTPTSINERKGIYEEHAHIRRGEYD